MSRVACALRSECTVPVEEFALELGERLSLSLGQTSIPHFLVMLQKREFDWVLDRALRQAIPLNRLLLKGRKASCKSTTS